MLGVVRRCRRVVAADAEAECLELTDRARLRSGGVAGAEVVGSTEDNAILADTYAALNPAAVNATFKPSPHDC